jgi:threonine/homoserine/homoserine lactone efflux protein
MTLSTWLLFLLTNTLLSLVPGPAVLFVVGTALRSGLKPGIGAGLGILTGNALYFLASPLGLGVVLASAAPLFVALKWVGAIYLVWLGVRALRAKPAVLDQSAPVGADRTAFAAWRTAVLLQLGNPKAIVFFSALLPQFVHPESALSVAAQIGILALIGIGSELLVLVGYAAIAARTARLAQDARLIARFERASGICLIGCAALAAAA